MRDDFAGFQELDVAVVGCSPNTVQQQAAFKAKYNLPFTLLADPDHKIAEDFGVWVLRERPSGEKFMGIQRSTFVIGPDGVIRRAFHQVVPAEHAKELLAALRGLETAAAGGPGQGDRAR